MQDEREVAVRGEGIRLGQLLKLAGVADSGGEAKELLAGGGVLVDGEVETRRGRTLADGARVHAAGVTLVVRTESGRAHPAAPTIGEAGAPAPPPT